MNIGVLALQGSVEEHVMLLSQLANVNVVLVKKTADLEKIDGLILPGGESTTLATLLKVFNMFHPLQVKIAQGLPVYGTCAGMILLAKEVLGEEAHLGLMDIAVKRNAYGRQIDSFRVKKRIEPFRNQLVELVFIRAPWIERVGPNVEVLYTLDGHIVAAKEKNMLVTSFHPELTKQTVIHRYFLDMIKTYKKEA